MPITRHDHWEGGRNGPADWGAALRSGTEWEQTFRFVHQDNPAIPQVRRQSLVESRVVPK